MFRRIVLLLAFLAVINALDPLTNAIDPLTNARDRLRSAPPSPSAIDPLNGCTMIGLTDDPATTLKGINIMAIDTSGTCYSPDTKFIVPCNLVIEPLIVTTIQVNSSSQTSTTDYTYDDNSRVSFEAHGGFGPFTVNARFTEGSSDYVHTITSNTVTYVSTIAEMQLYQITAPFLSMPLSAEFTDMSTFSLTNMNPVISLVTTIILICSFKTHPLPLSLALSQEDGFNKPNMWMTAIISRLTRVLLPDVLLPLLILLECFQRLDSIHGESQ